LTIIQPLNALHKGLSASIHVVTLQKLVVFLPA
jgi:hypothetical protein